MANQANKVTALRRRLESSNIITMPCAFDALSAKLIEQAGFDVSFMSGFGVSAARLGLPDTGLITMAEMVDQGRNICGAVEIPIIGDADTGYGNVASVQRTVQAYINAGFAGLMIEDQESPKRCGHTRGKSVIDSPLAYERLAAAVDARTQGEDIVIIARTDARASHGLDEAIKRGQKFAALGADVVFIEAPLNEDEMRIICQEINVATMANIVEQGDTPMLNPNTLEAIGFSIATYPLSLLSASVRIMQESLVQLKQGALPDHILDFQALQSVLGFDDYDANVARLSIATKQQ